jgi:hypothetical protein
MLLPQKIGDTLYIPAMRLDELHYSESSRCCSVRAQIGSTPSLIKRRIQYRSKSTAHNIVP